MASKRRLSSSIFVLCLLPPFVFSSKLHDSDANFLQCLSHHTQLTSTDVSRMAFTSTHPSYPTLLQSSIKNLRFASPATRKPLVIVAPAEDLHVRATVVCCRRQGLDLRVRSGGHDYEGLSYRSEDERPFAVLDLVNLRGVDVDVEEGTAWVEAGATLGELYYGIAAKSKMLGFPAGVCPTVGVGGHISGGGFGTMTRKYGLASDNVLDAKLVDANGRILDRTSIGEDLFWAIRGGGGGSFGVILSWNVKLVPVPPTVTVFNVHRSPSQGALDLVYHWQRVSPELHEDLFIRDAIQKQSWQEVEVVFDSLFLGPCEELLNLMAKSFAELGVQRSDCKEMTWIQSVLHFEHPSQEMPMESLLDRGSKTEKSFNAKSDHVTMPIPLQHFQRVWAKFSEDGAGAMIMDPYGGKMSSYPASASPFPHRQGNLYNIQYYVAWKEGGEDASKKHTEWLNRLYNEMGPYVSSPRTAYVNYRDLDLGRNEEQENRTSYAKAKVWGSMYFKDNFERLAMVKGRVDPDDFFRNEQSIPPLSPVALEQGAACGRGGISSTARRVLGIIARVLLL